MKSSFKSTSLISCETSAIPTKPLSNWRILAVNIEAVGNAPFKLSQTFGCSQIAVIFIKLWGWMERAKRFPGAPYTSQPFTSYYAITAREQGLSVANNEKCTDSLSLLKRKEMIIFSGAVFYTFQSMG
jgi:hypothetical protein